MAKNKRKRKLKEQDFQKVKLRVGKKLQPSQNATDTSFKSRAIFIPTQLNKDSEPTNQRNQTFKDLLAQVGHYSVTTRQEALVGLKDLFQCHENLLEENLGIVIKRVAEKMTDSEPSVRQSLLLLLCFVFPMVPQERMAPFSSLIIAHLSCAMTHIYDDIQHDSLGFLELCLRYFPKLMVTSSSQLIHNFVGMISHRSTSGVKMSKGLQPTAGKGLSVNPKGKLSSLRSRLKVLQQLLAFLKVVEFSSNPCQRESTISSMKNTASFTKPIIHFDKTQPTQVQILQHSVNEPKLLPFEFDSSSMFGQSLANTGNESNILSDERQAEDFMGIIVPLLLECWIECNPPQMTTGLPDSLSSSATDVMLAIAEILKVIFKAAQSNQEKNCNISEHNAVISCSYDAYFKDLNRHFMSYFPFSANPTPLLKKGKRKLGKSPQQTKDEKDGTSVLTLNLAICEIMLQFVSNNVTSEKKLHPSVQKLEEFVVESLELKAKGGTKAQLLQTEHVESLVTFADQIIAHHCLCAQQDPGSIKELLDATFNLHQSSHVMSGTKHVLMLFFVNLTFPENLNASRNKKVHGLVERWLAGLPNLLVQLNDNSPALTELVLGILKKAVMQSVLKPNDNFFSHLATFLSRDKGAFGNLSEAIQRSVLELLFHLPALNDKLLQVLVCRCQDGLVGVSVIQYILQILHYRSPCYEGFLSSPTAFSLPSYLSALLSVAIGFSRHQLSDCQDAVKHETTHKITNFKECRFVILEDNMQAKQSGLELSAILKIDDLKLWEDHEMILQAVCQCYRQCKQSKLLLHYMTLPLETFLTDFKVLPLTAVHSLLCVVKCVVELATDTQSTANSNTLPVKMLSYLAQLSLVCLQYYTTHESCTADLTSGSSIVKTHLFGVVIELLLVVPAILKEMFSLLLNVLSENLESVKQNSAAILTRMFSCEVKRMLLQSADIVQLVVPRILCPEYPLSRQKQCFADLHYQHSLFKVEAGLS